MGMKSERSLHNLLWMCMLACEDHSARYMFQNCKLGCDFKLNCICPVLYEREVYVDGKLRGMCVTDTVSYLRSIEESVSLHAQQEWHGTRV